MRTARFDEDRGALLYNQSMPLLRAEVSICTISPRAGLAITIEMPMPTATNEIINRLLQKLERLYLSHFDEISDRRKRVNITAEERMNELSYKIESLIASEPSFNSLAHIALFLQQVGQTRRVDGTLINFTMLAWIMEGARRSN